MPSDTMLFPVDDDHEAGDCVMQWLAAFKEGMYAHSRLAGRNKYRVLFRA